MEASRTRHASDALHLSDLINLKFAPTRYGTERPRYLRVTEPDGPSTDGGRKARQAIMLCTLDDERRNVVCGFVDSVKKICELRSHPVISEAYQRRHQEDFDLSAGEYRRINSDLRDFLDNQGIELRIEHTPVRPRPPSTVAPQPTPVVVRPPQNAIHPGFMFAFAFSLGFASCLALVLLNVVG